eukprot:2111009-Rhodomonas_salina.3
MFGGTAAKNGSTVVVFFGVGTGNGGHESVFGGADTGAGRPPRVWRPRFRRGQLGPDYEAPPYTIRQARH